MPRLSNGTAYRVTGRHDAPALTLIHGLGLCQDVWEHQVASLSSEFKIITFDLYGHGQSAAAPATPSLSVFAQQVADLLAACNVTRTGLVGFSLGGMIARRVAQDFPGLLSAMAILHSAHRRTPDAQRAIEARVMQAKIHGPAATVEDALGRWFTASFREANPDIMDRVRGWVLANDPDIYPQNYHVLAQGVAEIIQPDPPLDLPTLVISADEDFGNSPEMAHAIAAEIPGSETLILKGLRHMALTEDPAQTTDALSKFFKTHLPETSK